MQNFEPIAIIFFASILDRIIYPIFPRYRIKFSPINQISFGFIVGSVSMLYAAVLQHFIYKSEQCYEHPLQCLVAI